VLLRRLADPTKPYVGTPGASYNPYVTVDYMTNIPVWDGVKQKTASQFFSLGKTQPYGGLNQGTMTAGTYLPVQGSPVTSQQATTPSKTNSNLPPLSHTFGAQNNPMPPSGQYDWLVHLDRQVVSPMELLQVSGYPPYMLTQRFMLGDDTNATNQYKHRVPWFDEDLTYPQQSHRLYRAFEFFYTMPLATYTPPLTASSAVGARIPGKININDIWDLQTFQALCDPQKSNNFSDVSALFQQVLQSRTPGHAGGLGGGPGARYNPFVGMAAGFIATGDTQYPNGSSIENTLLRSSGGSGQGPRLFQPTSLASSHPYLQDQLLSKIFTNVTTRSNVFAVWVTVGFFQVLDNQTPPTLGSEIGLPAGKPIRHRMFAIVDRSQIVNSQGAPGNPGPKAHYDPNQDRNVVRLLRVLY